MFSGYILFTCYGFKLHLLCLVVGISLPLMIHVVFALFSGYVFFVFGGFKLQLLCLFTLYGFKSQL